MNSLEALDNLIKGTRFERHSKGRYFDTVENSLKSLEIIITKRVDISELENCDTLKEYNDFVIHKLAQDYNGIIYKMELLTQEDFDIVKKELNNESNK